MSREGTHFIGIKSRSCYINGKFIIINSHPPPPPPSTSLSVILSTRTYIREGQDYEILQYYIDVRREVLPTPCGTTTADAISKLTER